MIPTWFRDRRVLGGTTQPSRHSRGLDEALHRNSRGDRWRLLDLSLLPRIGVNVIYEVRDYHFRRDRFDDYRIWATDAFAVLASHFDVVGFWFETSIAPEASGSDPMDLSHGLPNLTWIIRWESMDKRICGWDELETSKDWLAILEKHPAPDGYLQVSARFMEGLPLP